MISNSKTAEEPAKPNQISRDFEIKGYAIICKDQKYMCTSGCVLFDPFDCGTSQVTLKLFYKTVIQNLSRFHGVVPAYRRLNCEFKLQGSIFHMYSSASDRVGAECSSYVCGEDT